MRKLIVVVLLAGSAALVGCKGDNATQTTGAASTPPVTPVAVDVTVAGYDALEAAVNQRKGNVVLVDFWATWCGPCKKKFPDFVALHTKFAEKGLACMSVSLDEPALKEEALTFLKAKGATFPNFIVSDYKKEEVDAKLTKRFGLEGVIPHMVMFDRGGNKVWTNAELKEQLETDKITDEQYKQAVEKRVQAELAK